VIGGFMKIVVLAGGLSPERDVSLSSGSLIANSLMESGHDVLLLDVYEGIKDETVDYQTLFQNSASGKKYEYNVNESEPDLEAIKARNNNQTAFIGNHVLDLCKFCDVVFIALHGSIGENGMLQATFDNFNINYTGTGYIGSLLAMDKDITKKLFVQSGIITADWILYETKDNNIDLILDKIGFPLVVKPCSCGSSVGVSIVNDRTQLNNALDYATKYESYVLIEKMVKGREFSVGILDNTALPIIEIIPIKGFYDYKNKYQGGLTKEVCPAELEESLTKKLQETALNVHKALRLGDYSRIDFIMDDNNEFICLEANTLPGMTPTSLLPQEAKAAGISYSQLCEKIAFMPFKN
jgi:D-alanine-D-alanine ligase